jgi:hypothetical protein
MVGIFLLDTPFFNEMYYLYLRKKINQWTKY